MTAFYGGFLNRYIVFLLLLTAFFSAKDGEVSFKLEAYDNLSREDKVSFIVPFPEGFLTGTEDVLLVFPEQKLFPKQKIISKWKDNSVKLLELSVKGLEGRPVLAGKLLLGTFEKERKEAVEKELLENPELQKNKEAEKLPGWQKEKLKTALGKIETFSKPQEYKIKAFAIFEPKWYCETRVWGELLPAADNFRWRGYEEKFKSGYILFVLPGKKPEKTELSYYDTAHALFQMYLRDGNKEYLSAGHKEAKRYIDEELFREGPYYGQHRRGKGIPLPPAGLSLLYLQGLADDYILTGDTASLEWAKIMGEQLLKNIRESDLKLNEFNSGWPTVELLALYNLTGEERYFNKAKNIIELALGWQDVSGGWKRVYLESEGCTHGHKGGSAFMTAILCEGLINYHLLTGDKKTEKALLKAADWLIKEMYIPNQRAFRYTQCPLSTAPGIYSLNPLFLEMLGYATYISKDEKYRNVALEVLEDTIKTGNYADSPETFVACYRNSGKGLYWLYKNYVPVFKKKPVAAPPEGAK